MNKRETVTLPALIKKVSKVLGDGTIIHHTPTERNKIGQSGVHTFVCDIQDIIDEIVPEAKNGNRPQEINRALMKMLLTQQ